MWALLKTHSGKTVQTLWPFCALVFCNHRAGKLKRTVLVSNPDATVSFHK